MDRKYFSLFNTLSQGQEAFEKAGRPVTKVNPEGEEREKFSQKPSPKVRELQKNIGKQNK